MARISRYALSTITTLVLITAGATLIWPQWFEALSGTDPDGGDGSLERWISRGLAVLALAVLIGIHVLRRGRITTRAGIAESHGSV